MHTTARPKERSLLPTVLFVTTLRHNALTATQRTFFTASSSLSHATITPSKTPVRGVVHQPHLLYGPPGRKELVLIDTRARLEEISRLPAWTATRSAAPVEPSYRVEPVPDKGLGLVATRDIKSGEMILSEPPLLLFGYQLSTVDSSGLDRVFADAVNGLSTRSNDAYLALHNSSLPDYPLLARLKTNGHDLWKKADYGPSVFEANCGVFNEISRANHSCTPNAHFSFCLLNNLEGTLHAGLSIQRGEEICISYIGTEATRATRQAALRNNHRIECKCATCTMDPDRIKASDARRVEIGNFAHWLASHPELSTLDELEALLADEKLLTAAPGLYFIGFASSVVRGGRQDERAQVWAGRTREAYAAMFGGSTPLPPVWAKVLEMTGY